LKYVPASRLATLARGFNLTGWLDSRAPQRPDPTLREPWTHWNSADGFGFEQRISGREMPDELIVVE